MTNYYPKLPDPPPKPNLPTPEAVNRTRRKIAIAPAGTAISATGKIAPVPYGTQFIRPMLGPALYGEGDAILQSRQCLGLDWIVCQGPITAIKRIYTNDNYVFPFSQFTGHQERENKSRAYTYFSMTTYHGLPDQPVDPVLANMFFQLPNRIVPYADDLVYRESGLAVGMCHLATAQNDLYNTEMIVPTAVVLDGLATYDPRSTNTEFSRNPVLHLADFLSASYGAGWLPDWDSVGDSANYADEIVDGKPRYVGGYLITGSERIETHIERMRALAGVIVRRNGNKFSLHPDKPGTSVFTFTDANIVDGSFNLAYRPLLDKPSKVVVRYTKGFQNGYEVNPPWANDEVYYPGPTDPGYSTDPDERRVATYDLLDCQDFYVAKNYAKRVFERTNNSRWRVALRSKDMSAILYHGEIVTVSHPWLPADTEFIIRKAETVHGTGDITWAFELEEYAPSSYVTGAETEPNPVPELQDPGKGYSGSTVLPLVASEDIIGPVLVNVSGAADDQCRLACAINGYPAEGFVSADAGGTAGAIVSVSASEGLIEGVAVTATGYLGQDGAIVDAPPIGSILTQPVAYSYDASEVIFHAGPVNQTRWLAAYAPKPSGWWTADEVQDGGWLMRCNRATLDRPAPQLDGEPTWLVDDATTSRNSTNTRIVLGAQYAITSALNIDRIKYLVEEPGVTHVVTLWNAEDASAPRPIETFSIVPQAIGEIILPLSSPLVVPGGSTLWLSGDFQKTTTGSSFTYTWVHLGTSAAQDPGAGNVARSTDDTQVFISQQDKLLVDRTSDLMTLSAGDALSIAEQSATNRFLSYTITADPTDNGTWWTIPVELQSSGSSVRSNRDALVSGTSYSGYQFAYYAVQGNYWNTSPYAGQISGFLTTSYAGIPGSLNNAFYGLDISVSLYVKSPDWDIKSVSSLAGTGSGQNAVYSVNNALPDALGNVQFQSLSIGAEAAETGVDLDIRNEGGNPVLQLKSGGDYISHLLGDQDKTAAGGEILRAEARWNGNAVARLIMHAGTELANQDDGRMSFDLGEPGSGGVLTRILRLEPTRIGLFTAFPTAPVEIGAQDDSVEVIRVSELAPGDVFRLYKNGDVVTKGLYGAAGLTPSADGYNCLGKGIELITEDATSHASIRIKRHDFEAGDPDKFQQFIVRRYSESSTGSIGGLSVANSSFIQGVNSLTNFLCTNNTAGKWYIVLGTSAPAPTLTAELGRVGIGTATPDSSVALDVVSTTGGMAPPRMTTAERDAISSPIPQIIYNTTLNKFQGFVTGTGWVDFH